MDSGKEYYYDGGFIPDLSFDYKKVQDIIMLISGKQTYEIKRDHFLKMMKYLYENTYMEDDDIYMTDNYADGKMRPYLDIIANNPYAVWATKYRGITTKTIELLSSNFEGMKQNQLQLLSINGVRKDANWEISFHIQSYKVGNNDVVKQMKRRLELSHEASKGIIRNAGNLIYSWSNMWDHEKIVETALVDELSTTALDEVSTTRDETTSKLGMNNTIKDDERYPMNQTMDDAKAMQLKIGKEFTLTDLIMHKFMNKSAEYCNGCQDVIGAIYNLTYITKAKDMLYHLKYLPQNFIDIPHRNDCLVENTLKFILHHFTMVCQDIAVSPIPSDEWMEAISQLRENAFNHSMDPKTFTYPQEKKVELYSNTQRSCLQMLNTIIAIYFS